MKYFIDRNVGNQWIMRINDYRNRAVMKNVITALFAFASYGRFRLKIPRKQVVLS